MKPCTFCAIGRGEVEANVVDDHGQGPRVPRHSADAEADAMAATLREALGRD